MGSNPTSTAEHRPQPDWWSAEELTVGPRSFAGMIASSCGANVCRGLGKPGQARLEGTECSNRREPGSSCS